MEPELSIWGDVSVMKSRAVEGFWNGKCCLQIIDRILDSIQGICKSVLTWFDPRDETLIVMG